MPQQIDVVVPVNDPKAFRRLLGSVDSEPVPARAFGVLAMPVGLSDAEVTKLRTLARHRPNLEVGGEAADWWGAALSTSRAEYVLPVADHERLAPGALQRVLDAATDSSDALMGRAVMPGGSTDWAVFADGSTPSEHVLERTDAGRLAVVMRRDLVSSAAQHVSVLDVRRAALATLTPVQVLRGDPLLLGTPASSEASRPGTDGVRAAGTWAEGSLHLDLQVPGPGAGSYVVVRSLETGLDWRLPLQQTDSTTTVVVDPLASGDGRPLAAGRWVLDLYDGDAVHAITWSSNPGSALLGDLAVATVRGAGGRVVLDLGATHRSPLRDLDAALAQIHEDARGTHLDWVLPFAHVTGEATLPAVIRVGDFPLRAELVSQAGSARLRTWLSGLPTRSAVAVSLAGSPFHPTGHDLVIAHTGEMELQRTPREPRAARGGPAKVSRSLPSRAGRVIGRIASRLRSRT